MGAFFPWHLSKMEFVKSRTWCQVVARINGVFRPEGPVLPAQAVRPGGQDRVRVHRPFRAKCLVNRDPGLTAEWHFLAMEVVMGPGIR